MDVLLALEKTMSVIWKKPLPGAKQHQATPSNTEQHHIAHVKTNSNIAGVYSIIIITIAYNTL